MLPVANTLCARYPDRRGGPINVLPGLSYYYIALLHIQVFLAGELYELHKRAAVCLLGVSYYWIALLRIFTVGEFWEI